MLTIRSDKVKDLALDLTRNYPCSPYALLGGYVQVFLKTYIQENLSENAIIRVFFDMFDIEEKRIMA